MNNRTFPKAILTILTLVLSHNICEAQTKRTIHVATAGTLSNYISEDDKYQITDLTLTGEINGDDLGFLREMAGRSFQGWTDEEPTYANAVFDRTDGKLTYLDLSGVRIVAGGCYMISWTERSNYWYGNLKEDDQIPSWLFYQCSGLTSVTLPNSMTSIEDRAFSYCSGLLSVTLPNSVTSIGYLAFDNCSALTSVKIPNSVSIIVDRAFRGCSGLTSIVSEIKKPFTINDDVFDNSVYSAATLTVPAGTKAAYQSTKGWNNFRNIVEASGSQGGEIGDVFQVDGLFYKIQDNNNVFVTSGDSKYEGDIVIPEQVTFNGAAYSVVSIEERAFFQSNIKSITIPSSVTSIDTGAFVGCHDLTSLTIPGSVSTIGEAAFFECKSLKSLNISKGVKTIGRYAFGDCIDLTSIIIPNSVEIIGDQAFSTCDDLTSVTIPNSVQNIGNGAFSGCKKLSSIVSEIQNPFVISDGVFYPLDIYLNAILTVPAGTKAAYQSTDGWKNFTNIVEEGETDEVEFTIDGTTYQGSKSDNSAIVKSVDPNMTSVEIPASVSYDGATYQITGIDDHAFDGSKMAALIWDVEAALSSKAFNNANIGSNFLLYVKSESYAPSSVMNVIVDGSANNIVLSDDGGAFYCPQAFTAHAISYTHYYSMETGGEGKGWETIALPFNVQKINHSTRGEIVPFALFNASSSQKPFWLASFSGSSFKRASSIQANEPYIIAMPNSSSYQNDYILTGNVTFSAENTSVPKTPTFSGKFVPTFSTVSKSSKAFALNAVNRYVSATGNYDAGSRFISNLRDVRPFEAYISSSSSTRGVIEIDFDDDKTGLDNILFSTDENSEVAIYTISGRKVGTSLNGRLDETIEQLPKGVYIVNGKKIVK